MAHLSVAWGNAVRGSLVLQGVRGIELKGTPDLKPPRRTRWGSSGVPTTRAENVPQSCEERAVPLW